MILSRDEIRTYRDTAAGIIRGARTIVTKGLAGDLTSRRKADGSFVTDIDLAVEDFIRSRIADDIPDEIIACGERRQFVKADRTILFDTLMQAHDGVRTYSDCFGHALAAEGSFGAMVDYNTHIWDVAATEVLMREVGGAFVRIDVDPDRRPVAARHNVVFGKPTVVQWVLGIIDAEAGI